MCGVDELPADTSRMKTVISHRSAAGTISSQADAYERYAVAVGAVVLLINIAFVVSDAWQVARVVKWRALGGKVKGAFGKLVGVRMPVAPTAGMPASGLAGKTGDIV